MKSFKDITEQHREKGRFKPVKLHNVPNVPVVSPRPSSDSANVKLKEDLRRWFSKTDPEGGWKRINSKGEAIGPCAREPGEPKPKCMSNEKRAALSKKERASAVRAKRKHDPNPERKGAPINVSNFGKGKISEDMENLNEKNVPTSPEKWAQAKAQAKAKFDVYPSAYANGWAAKKYKAMGGGWKSVSEAKDEQEYGYEGDMALNQIATLMRCAEMIKELLKPDTDMPEWVQSKITLATDYIQTAADYMYSEMNESTSARVRLANAMKKAQEQREREERAGEALLNPKKPEPVKEDIMQEREDDEYHTPTRHNVQVQVSKGGGEKTYRKATVRAKEPKHAVNAAIAHYKQQGYTVHDHKYLGEQVEQIDELSKSTLASYAKKATHDARLRFAQGKDFERISKSSRKPEYKAGAKEWEDKYKSDARKREAGVNKAIDRLAKEEVEQIDELSKGTLSSYLNKKKAEYMKGKTVSGSKENAKDIQNMGKAHDKLNKEEVEQINEGRPSQRHPLEGHEYHKKSNEALIHIAKDAHAAAEAMKGHNTEAENKYRDQANDSATVRHFRQKSGMPDWYKKKYGLEEGRMKALATNADFHPEIKKDEPPFEGPYKKTPKVVVDKSGAKHSPMSRVRDLARAAARKQGNVKESVELQESRKMEIVREAMKVAKDKKKNSDDKFIADPELSSKVVKTATQM